MSRLNKSVKLAIVDKAISDKFKDEYEKASRAVDVAARELAITQSLHNELKPFKLPVEITKFIPCDNSWQLSDGINSTISFIGKKYYARFDSPVYCVNKEYSLRDDRLPELASLRKLVKKIEYEHSALLTVISSYNNVKKLVADLPWVEKYLPTTTSVGTSLIAADVIADINAKFGK